MYRAAGQRLCFRERKRDILRLCVKINILIENHLLLFFFGCIEIALDFVSSSYCVHILYIPSVTALVISSGLCVPLPLSIERITVISSSVSSKSKILMLLRI